MMAMPQIDGYVVHEELGSGASGIVYRASVGAISNDSQVAVKVYDPERGEKHFRKEREFLKAVNGHPNVAGLVASIEGAPNVLVMPLYRGPDLDTLVRRLGPLGEVAAKQIFQDLLAATQHIHDCGVLHRDIKPDNILISGDGSAVLVDFDVSCYTSETADPKLLSAGTAGYISPEVISREPYGKPADLFSIGCTLYFMFRKRPPFYTKPHSQDAVFRKTIRCKYQFGACFDDVSEPCKDLISALVCRDPDGRLTGEQAFQHRWMAGTQSDQPTSTEATTVAIDAGGEGSSATSFAGTDGSQADSSSLGFSSTSMEEQRSLAPTQQLQDISSTEQNPDMQTMDRPLHAPLPRRPSGNPSGPMPSFRAARLQGR
eukprot:TRINITY_DN5654_c0_g3_i1.p1 TRINITY_DN5654_c0_g3~~TRINITY_DN5654_c0_g3_i1.p1  ORF type:complete len:373 (+),score=78.57 TRINITY_DN5654_c0_g3_i1:102-1220(+)